MNDKCPIIPQVPTTSPLAKRFRGKYQVTYVPALMFHSLLFRSER